MKRLLILSLLFPLLSLKDKNNYLLKINPLMERIEHGMDTTYVVNFWATWCSPCVAELPQFGLLDSAWTGKKVKVILMSLDFEKDIQTKMLPLLKKKNLNMEVHVIDETNDNVWMPRVNGEWQGNIPATLIRNTRNKKELFLPRETSFHELDSVVSSFQN
ncbi:MAG TPA: TlpA disulfide reductase family protein [Bacteroidia bacterium]|jgi:thiol-disulfide isomerase/thioredoxin|nr:TlpA disulfide reductase family protein [Bacteroidia bacterium]